MNTTRWTRGTVLAISLGVLLATVGQQAEATNHYVSATSGSPTSPYTNWASAAVRIEDAIAVAAGGDLIWVTNGTYASTGAVGNAAMLSVTNGITLRSVAGAGTTIIDGNYPAVTNRCLFLNHASAVVDGFTIRNGYALGGGVTNQGGGVYVQVNGTVRNCLIMLNTAAGDGGGVYVMTNATVVNCTIASNTALTAGGGLAIRTNATVQNSIVYFNTAASSANFYTNMAATFAYTCANPIPAGAGNTAADPLFVNLAAADFHIATNSPCVNAGLFQTWMDGAVDLDGQPRLMGQVDIGVDEETRFFYVAKHGTNTNAGTQANPWGTIQYAVTNAAIQASDTILAGEGTYTENVTFPAGGKNSLTLQGGYNTNDWTWAPAVHRTIIKAAINTSDVLYLRSWNHKFIGLTLTAGRYGANCDNDLDSRFTFSHCIISSNVQDGIRLSGANHVDLFMKNCLVANNGANGIYWYQDSPATYIKEIYNCTIVNNGGSGIYDAYTFGRNIYLYNCIIANNAYGLNRGGGPALYMANSCVYGNTIENIWRVDAPSITFQSGNLWAYPAFAGTGDYHLQNGSPCVAYGQDLTASGVMDDLDGNPRTGAPYDIGCYQSSYAAAARYATTYVDASRADESGDGQSWATAKKTIGTGVAFASPGGTCMVGSGAYHEDIFVPANMTVSGTNRTSTIVSSAWHAASMLETNATLRGLTLSGGIRGVDIANDNATVQNCVLCTNTYGLVLNRPGTKVNECVITNNTTYGIWGNGITGAGVGMTVRNCLIARNGSSGAYLGWDNAGANWSQLWNKHIQILCLHDEYDHCLERRLRNLRFYVGQCHTVPELLLCLWQRQRHALQQHADPRYRSQHGQCGPHARQCLAPAERFAVHQRRHDDHGDHERSGRGSTNQRVRCRLLRVGLRAALQVRCRLRGCGPAG